MDIAATVREPIVTFALLIAVILLIPPLFERLRLPGLVGLLAAGVLFGPSGLNWLHPNSESMKLLADIGKIYLMFVAGLEIDLEQFRRTKNRSFGFGLATFAVPLLTGILVGRLFEFDWNASVLIGSLLASHTLLAYPIVKRLGVISDEAVIVTIGATIFTDIGALLVLAVCVGINQGDFSPANLAILLVSLAIYAVAILWGFDKLGKEFFRRSKNDQGNQFLFVLLAVFLASVGAQLIGVEMIVGAFLAGLAVNDVLGDGPVKEKVEFIGSVLFIPIFFVAMGLLLDLGAFAETLSSFGLTLAIIGGLMASKFLAALAVKLIYRYSWTQTLTMWSLSVPQVAATLAATLVGYEEGILPETVFNSVILMMLVTAMLGPLVTTRTAAKLAPESTFSDEIPPASVSSGLTVVVPVYNPQTERYLMEMAALLARQVEGRTVPLAIAKAQARMDAPQMERAIARCQDLLAQATHLSRELGVEVMPKLRIEFDVAEAISHAAREEHADLIVLGMSDRVGFRARLFGNITDSVLWSAHCIVAVARLLDSPLTTRRILVPVSHVKSAARLLEFAQLLAQPNGASVTLLHVCHPSTPHRQRTWLYDQLTITITALAPSNPVDIRIIAQESVSAAIGQASRAYDLVIVRSQRRRIGGDGLALSEVTAPILQKLVCSVILLGEPQGKQQWQLFNRRQGVSL
ncbi:MAG: cation:proton antiporter [Cyanophyceae cyanobacterium]